MALEHPRTSAAAGIILAAAIVGGVLWYIFGTRAPGAAQRRRAACAPEPAETRETITGRGAAAPSKIGG